MEKEKNKQGPFISINPSLERLYSKLITLERDLALIETRHLNAHQEKIVEICKSYLKTAREYVVRNWRRKHPHLIWEFLHRVDEYLILLYQVDELLIKAVKVKEDFDLNIREEKVRTNWIGDKGKLKEAIEHIRQKKEEADEYRNVVKDALTIVNEEADRNFWQVSMNVFTSVASGALLAVLMLLALLGWLYVPGNFPDCLRTEGLLYNYKMLVILGLIGAYASNILTRDNFLYIRGAPFWRYLLHHLFAKPVLSSFVAVFIYVIEKSKLIFSINPIDVEKGGKQAQAALSQVINIQVSQEGVGYVYVALAIVSAFAADKVLRNMIDQVLKKLEAKAEKTKNTKKE
jgi:hypothetical protein